MDDCLRFWCSFSTDHNWQQKYQNDGGIYGNEEHHDEGVNRE